VTHMRHKMRGQITSKTLGLCPVLSVVERVLF